MPIELFPHRDDPVYTDIAPWEPMTIVPSMVARERANKAKYGLGYPFEDETLDKDILSGNEEASRIRELQREQLSRKATRMDTVRQQLEERAEGLPMTPEEVERVSNIITGDTEDLTATTVFERTYAKRLMKDMIDSSEALKEDPAETKRVLDAGETAITFKENWQRLEEDLHARYNAQSWGQTIFDYSKYLVPGLSWYNMSSSYQEGKTGSFMPGNEMKEYIESLHLMPPSEAYANAKATIEEMENINVLDALEFSRALRDYSTSDFYLWNLIGAGDLATIPAAVPKSAVAALTRATKQLVKRNKAPTTVPIDFVPLQGGPVEFVPLRGGPVEFVDLSNDVDAAGELLAVEQSAVRETLENTDGAGSAAAPNATSEVNYFEPMLRSFPGTMNFAEILKDSSILSKNRATKLSRTLQRHTDEIFKGFTERVAIHRLNDEQRAAAIEESKRLFQMDYPNANDAVLDVKPYIESVTNTEWAAIYLGKRDGGFYATPTSVQNAADNYFKLLEYDIQQHGDGKYYIVTSVPIDETSPVIRDLEVATKAKTPVNKANIGLWWARTREALVSPTMREDMKAMTYGSSHLMNMYRKAVQPYGALSKRRKNKLTKYMRWERDYENPVTGNRGTFARTSGEFERRYNEIIGHKPSRKDVAAYFSFTRMYSLDYAALNMGIYRDKTRQGIRNFSLPLRMGDNATTTGSIEGKRVENIPFNTPEPAGILFWDADPQNFKYSLKQFTKEDAVQPNYKVVQLSPEGRRALLDDPDLAPHLPKGRIDFVVTRDAKVVNLPLQQLPYKPGGHVRYPENAYFIGQPDIKASIVGDRITSNTYYGDLNALTARSEKEARQISDKMEQGRQLLVEAGFHEGTRGAGAAKVDIVPVRKGRPPRGKTETVPLDPLIKLDNFLQENLPWTSKEFAKLFKTAGNPKGIFDINTPFRYRKSGENMIRKYNLKDEYHNLTDANESPYNLYNSVNLRDATERGHTLNTVERTGSETSPAWSFVPSELIDPTSTVHNMMTTTMNARHTDDLRIKAAEQFVNEFGDLLVVDKTTGRETPKEILRRDVVKHLLNPTWKNVSQDNFQRLFAAKNYRRALLETLGHRTDYEQAAWFVKSKMSEWIYDNVGKKPYEYTEPILMKNRSISNSLRAFSFDAKFWGNPVQFWQQIQTLTGLTGVVGIGRSMRSGYQATFMQLMSAHEKMFGLTAADLDEVARRLSKVGVDAETFKNSWQDLERSGWNTISREVAILGDLRNPAPMRGGGLRDFGRIFFKEGERYVRLTAWNAAYEEFRVANPGIKRLSDANLREVLNRADILNVTMSQASNAWWNKGAAGVMTQFWTYQARLAELILKPEGRLTRQERLRLVAANALVYGLPAGAVGGTIGFWPALESVKQYMLDAGIEYRDNIFTRTLVDGLADVMLHFVTGADTNFTERFAPGGISFLREAITSDDNTWFEVFGGVSGTVLADIADKLSPLLYKISSVMDEDGGSYPIFTKNDIHELATVMSAYNHWSKAYTVTRFNEYWTRNGLKVDDITDMEALTTSIFGTTPQKVQDVWDMLDNNESFKNHQNSARREAIKNLRLYLEAEDKDSPDAEKFFKRYQWHIYFGDFQPDERASLLRQGLKNYEDLATNVERKFMSRSRDQRELIFKRREGREE